MRFLHDILRKNKVCHCVADPQKFVDFDLFLDSYVKGKFVIKMEVGEGGLNS